MWDWRAWVCDSRNGRALGPFLLIIINFILINDHIYKPPLIIFSSGTSQVQEEPSHAFVCKTTPHDHSS